MQTALQKIPTLLRDALFTLLFGLLSGILSTVEFQNPVIVNSDLREIPFLICLFHLRNPLFVFGLALSAFYKAPADMPIWAVYITHLVPLLLAFFSFKALERSNLSSVRMGIFWVAITIAYYLFALLPLVVISVSVTPSFNPNGARDFWEVYLSGLPNLQYEMVTTSLVTGLYLTQMRIRRELEDTNKNLENIVTERTNELQTVNEELIAANEGTKRLNENLEQLVKERTDKINAQLEQLRKYAYMNSHELRAPLARILGLLQLFKHEQIPEQTKMLLGYMEEASIELDTVIRQMNRLLEDEVTVNE
jgi:signal transduction histidine kinase